MSDPENNLRMPRNIHKQSTRATEELITGDSDDPPLSEEEIMALLEYLK